MIKHLACIMDGNRRWAKAHGWKSLYGHRQGARTVEMVADFCLARGISYLSLYTFSLENFKRSDEEKNYLFDLLVQESEKNIDLFVKKGIRICFLGDRTLFPPEVLASCEKVERATAHVTQLQVNFLFCYGARQEIVAGVKKLVRQVCEGVITEKDISEDTFSDALWTHGLPDPEIIIRTGNMRRLSNFMLYQAAYSEIYFLECMWPELTEKHLEDVLVDFAHCRRNFGA